MSFQKGNRPPRWGNPRSLRIRRGREGTGSILDTKNIASAFGLFGKQGTGHPHGFFHVLIVQGFLGSFGDFPFDDVFGFAFDTSRQPRFQATQNITRQFQRIPSPFKALETPTHEIHHQPFSTLIIPFVHTKSCQTSPTHGTFFALHQGQTFVCASRDPLFIPSSSFFAKGHFQPFFGSVTSGTTRRAQRHGLPPSDQGWNESG